MGIFDFFKRETKSKIKTDKFSNINEVSVIIKPKVSKNGVISFYDLRGTRVTNIPPGKRDISVDNNCYLGLKKFKSTERWVPIISKEVETNINSKDFLLKHSSKTKEELKKEKQSIEKEKQLIEKQRKEKLKESKYNILKEFDKDNNGVIDIVESDDFMKLFRKHQQKIIHIDKDFVNRFVKISNYLKTKQSNIQKIFSSIKKSNTQNQLEECVGMLNNQIHTYEILLFHSINMITSIAENDLITVNEIFEEFDKLKVFKSDHEKEISEKLDKIGDGLQNLMYTINRMERSMIDGLSNLSYVTEQGFSDLNESVTGELNSINSSIKFNNLLTGIQTYQMYKINKNTKSLT